MLYSSQLEVNRFGVIESPREQQGKPVNLAQGPRDEFERELQDAITRMTDCQ